VKKIRLLGGPSGCLSVFLGFNRLSSSISKWAIFSQVTSTHTRVTFTTYDSWDDPPWKKLPLSDRFSAVEACFTWFLEGSEISLVGGFNPSEKYYSVGMIIPNIWKNKSHVPTHQPDHKYRRTYWWWGKMTWSSSIDWNFIWILQWETSLISIDSVNIEITSSCG